MAISSCMGQYHPRSVRTDGPCLLNMWSSTGECGWYLHAISLLPGQTQLWFSSWHSLFMHNSKCYKPAKWSSHLQISLWLFCVCADSPTATLWIVSDTLCKEDFLSIHFLLFTFFFSCLLWGGGAKISDWIVSSLLFWFDSFWTLSCTPSCQMNHLCAENCYSGNYSAIAPLHTLTTGQDQTHC